MRNYIQITKEGKQMNTNKRILSVLMCIAMILSMFSSFAFAAGSGNVASVTDEYTGVVDKMVWRKG